MLFEKLDLCFALELINLNRSGTIIIFLCFYWESWITRILETSNVKLRITIYGNVYFLVCISNIANEKAQNFAINLITKKNLLRFQILKNLVISFRLIPLTHSNFMPLVSFYKP